MAREEEIERASIMYHVYHYDYSYEEGEHLELYIKGFTEGANWADEHPKNIWHDANEEPKEYPILVQDEFGNVWVQYSLKDYADGWKEFKGCECLTRWAYLSDLLPKGGGK